jgi:hypothetical protein
MRQGISSDQLFGSEMDGNPEVVMQRQVKLQELSGARAISSDMYFDRPSDSSDPGQGVGALDAREVSAF